jgi:endonuclease/exonuclease/phosphatase family metal-dependent hydrolase
MAGPGGSGFLRLQPLEHDLAPHYASLRAIPDRRALERSALWPRIKGELARVTTGVERGDCAPTLTPGATGRPLRLVAWNIQRGARFEALLHALRHHPVLRTADVLLLSEIDCGLGRSHNRNVARELGAALGMSYAFGPSYLTLGDDFGENREGRPNTTALAGNAILSRAALRRAENVELPELRDKFSSSEKRLGCKRALLAEIEAPAGPLQVAACHLDSNASPRQRVRQLAAVLDRLDGATPAIIGGDFNSSTHDLSSSPALVRDVLRKLLARGIGGTIDGYMTPERAAERPLFELLAARGCTLDGFNDRALATYHYDFNQPYALEKLRRAGGRALVWMVRRLLRRWDARLPARLDWFAGRGVRAISAAVVNPCDAEGRTLSDHAAIVCDAALETGGATGRS